MAGLKKQTTVLIGIILLVLVVLVFEKTPFFNNPSVESQPAPSVVKKTKSINISIETFDASGIDNVPSMSTSATYNFQEDDTPYSILLKLLNDHDWPIKIQEYDFGIFVESINYYESSSDMAWIYFVNNESGNVAADQYKLKRGDVIEWRYIAPLGE